MWLAMRFDAVEPLQVYFLQRNMFRQRLEDTIHSTQGNAQQK